MKKFHPCLLLFSLFIFNLSYSQVAINTTGNNANGSAMLDVESTTKGMLIPRMTTAQRTAIASPATGLLVYDNTTSSFWFYNGSAWTELVTGAVSGWKIIGNSGTDTSVNFIGTIDDKDLKFRVNNSRVGTLGTNGNVFFGLGAGTSSTTSILSNGLGSYSLNSNTTGNNNNALGAASLFSNISGNANNAVGTQTLYLNTTGEANIAFGHETMYSNTTGSSNTALGSYVLASNTTGYSNVGVGAGALSQNTVKSNLVAVGDSALFNNGVGALFSLQSSFNTAVGSKALYGNTSGNYNSALGFQSLYSNTSSTANTALGAFSLSLNTTGNRNTAAGEFALYKNTTANDNVAFGAGALFQNTTGHSNLAVGTDALGLNSTGSNSIAIGDSALHKNSSGGVSGTQGQDNIGIGLQAMFNNTQGESNTAVGVYSMYYNTTGTYNTALGHGADVISANLFNATAIGANAKVGADNSLILGSIAGVGGASSDVNVGIGTTTPTGRLHIKHNSYPVPTVLLEESENDFTRMRFINTNANSFWEMNALAQTSNTTARIEFWNNSAGTVTTPLVLYGNGNATLSGTLTQSSDIRLKKNIRPINNALDAIVKLNGYSYNWKNNVQDNTLQMGVIAQEVQQVFPSLVKQDDKGMLSVNYSGLIPVLIEAIKEQQKQIDELKQMLRK